MLREGLVLTALGRTCSANTWPASCLSLSIAVAL